MSIEINALVLAAATLLSAWGGYKLTNVNAAKNAQDQKRDMVLLLNEQLARQDERARVLEARIADLEKNTDARDNTIRDLRARIAELESLNMQKDTRAQILENRISELETLNMKLETEVRELKEREAAR